MWHLRCYFRSPTGRKSICGVWESSSIFCSAVCSPSTMRTIERLRDRLSMSHPISLSTPGKRFLMKAKTYARVSINSYHISQSRHDSFI